MSNVLKFKVVLQCATEPLDTVPFYASSLDVTREVLTILEESGWLLTVGDTIRILEVEA